MSPTANEPRRLTERAYWDSQYARTSEPSRHSGVGSTLKRVLGSRIAEWLRDYRDYLLWDVVYPGQLSAKRGGKVLEVGSAPGTHLVRLHQTFGLNPYGVEYSEQGVRVNRDDFAKHGIDPAQVIHADFFAPAFQSAHEGEFDVVVSHGFIEHFTDVRAVVAAHVRLLAKNGVLIITVPNLRGINYLLQWWFKRSVLPLHNLALMRAAEFAEAFANQGVTPIRCGYFGTFSFGLFAVDHASFWRRWSFWACWQVQTALNLAFRAGFGARGADAAFASPYLLYVGRKG